MRMHGQRHIAWHADRGQGRLHYEASSDRYGSEARLADENLTILECGAAGSTQLSKNREKPQGLEGTEVRVPSLVEHLLDCLSYGGNKRLEMGEFLDVTDAAEAGDVTLSLVAGDEVRMAIGTF